MTLDQTVRLENQKIVWNIQNKFITKAIDLETALLGIVETVGPIAEVHADSNKYRFTANETSYSLQSQGFEKQKYKDRSLELLFALGRYARKLGENYKWAQLHLGKSASTKHHTDGVSQLYAA